jgi:hypothetical protein
MSSTKGPGNPFIVSTGIEKADSETRKLIRSHVMLGKNLGKSRYVKCRKPQNTPKDSGGIVISNEGPGEPSDTLIKTPHTTIPNRVGSDVSFVEFADTIPPSPLADLLKCKLIAIIKLSLYYVQWSPDT